MAKKTCDLGLGNSEQEIFDSRSKISSIVILSKFCVLKCYPIMDHLSVVKVYQLGSICLLLVAVYSNIFLNQFSAGFLIDSNFFSNTLLLTTLIPQNHFD